MFLERRLDIEEIANSITHGFGAMLSVIGFVVLMSLAWTRGDGWHLLGCGIFGAALVMLYTASSPIKTDIPLGGPNRDLLADRRHLYAFYAGQHAVYVGLGVADDGLDAGALRYWL
jgi:hemolysin III